MRYGTGERIIERSLAVVFCSGLSGDGIRKDAVKLEVNKGY